MSRNRFLIAPIFIILFNYILVEAQPRPYQWGSVTAEELKWTTFEEDPDAKAVILVDYGEVFFNDQFELVFRHFRRIKILDPDGSEFTEASIGYNSSGRSQSLSRVRGQTINLTASGQVQRTTLGRRDYHEERFSDGYRRRNFAFKDVAPGSIVEYEYTLTSKSPMFLRSWYFQNAEPTTHSELRVAIPAYLDYARAYNGYVDLTSSSIDPYLRGTSPMSGSNTSVNGTLGRFILSNAPAIRSEAFITTVNDYRARMIFQLSAITDRYGVRTNILESWDKLGSDLMDNWKFGKEIRTNSDIRNKVRELTEGKETELEKAKAIYNFVVSEIEWDGELGLFTDNGVRQAFSSKKGNGAELSLLLVSMLREAGLESNPVLISTRNHGKVIWEYPMITRLNQTIVFVEADGEEYLLEPLFKDLPFGVLHPISLNDYGMMIMPDKTERVSVISRLSNRNRYYSTFSISPEGKLEGSLQAMFVGYDAIVNRIGMRGKNEEQYTRELLLGNLPNSHISSTKVEEKDNPDEPLRFTLELSNAEYVQNTGSMMFINPFVTNRTSENPFQLPNRTFPVDMNYASEYVIFTSFKKPENFVLEELPGSVYLTFDDRITYRQSFMENGDEIQVSATLRYNVFFFSPTLYSGLREFFDEVVSLQAQPIVLRKQDPAEIIDSE